jgi:hypothetical protein
MRWDPTQSGTSKGISTNRNVFENSSIVGRSLWLGFSSCYSRKRIKGHGSRLVKSNNESYLQRGHFPLAMHSLVTNYVGSPCNAFVPVPRWILFFLHFRYFGHLTCSGRKIRVHIQNICQGNVPISDVCALVEMVLERRVKILNILFGLYCDYKIVEIAQKIN